MINLMMYVHKALAVIFIPESRYIAFAPTTHRKLGFIVASRILCRGQVTWLPASTVGVWRNAPAWNCVYQAVTLKRLRNPSVPLLVCVLLRNGWFCGSTFLAWGKHATVLLELWTFFQLSSIPYKAQSDVQLTFEQFPFDFHHTTIKFFGDCVDCC
jgi:hypothetical protein